MNIIYKIVTITILVILIAAILFLWFIPSFKANRKISKEICEGTQEKVTLEREINTLTEQKANYFLLNALFEKYNTALPLTDNTSVLIDQLYEIGKYSGIKIQFVDFNEASETDSEINEANPVGVIGVNIMITGSYYQILTFLNTVEIMPRFIKVENISLNLSNTNDAENKNENNPDLTALINFKTFFDKTFYAKN